MLISYDNYFRAYRLKHESHLSLETTAECPYRSAEVQLSIIECALMSQCPNVVCYCYPLRGVQSTARQQIMQVPSTIMLQCHETGNTHAYP